MIRPMIRPLIRPMIRSMIASSLTQRIFIDLDPVTQEHYTLQNPVVETGDFSHSFKFSVSAYNSIILGRSGSGADFVYILPDGTIRVRIADSNGNSTLTVTLNDLHSATLSRVGSLVTLVVDGVQFVSYTNSGSYTIDLIGNFSTIYFNGYVSNVDLGNGNDWKLERDPENAEQAVNGNNLLTYVNIPTGLPSRELFTLNQAGTQWDGNNGTTLVIA